MVTDDEKQAFAARLNEALNDIRFPAKGAGRQGGLGAKMGVSQKGARKWLEGESIPETSRMFELARWLGVNFEWLATGRGDKRAGVEVEAAAQTSDTIMQTVVSGGAETVQRLSEATSSVASAVTKILREIDGQHRLAAISDDDATLLRAALHAVQADIAPPIRAAILLMLGAQNSREEGKNAFNPPFKTSQAKAHSPSGKDVESPAAFARHARAGTRSAAQPESDDEHDTGKHGT